MSADTTTAGGVTPVERSDRPIAAGVNIGHVHLKTADIDRVHDFYVGILGFDIVTRIPQALFLSAGGYHHHLGFNTWESKGGSPPPPGTTGLYHVATKYRPAPRWATRSAAWSPQDGRSTATTTTARTRRFTSAIRTRTASSWPGTVRNRSGLATPRDTWRSPTAGWTSKASWPKAPERSSDQGQRRGAVRPSRGGVDPRGLGGEVLEGAAQRRAGGLPNFLSTDGPARIREGLPWADAGQARRDQGSLRPDERLPPQPERGPGAECRRTGFVSSPRPSIRIVTRSPSRRLKSRGGTMPVPVRRTQPSGNRWSRPR